MTDEKKTNQKKQPIDQVANIQKDYKRAGIQEQFLQSNTF